MKVNLDDWAPGEDVDADAIVSEFLDAIHDFVRTPEWSVSMLEDIAAHFHTRFEVGEDFDEGDHRAWESH